MIAYEELERALARWKARRSGAATDNAAESPPVDEPKRNGVSGARTRTGEIDIHDVVESYDETL